MLLSFVRDFPKIIRRIRANKQNAAYPCPICQSPTAAHDSIDFNTSCEDAKLKPFPDSGLMVDYRLCPMCGHCFAPQFQEWTHERFAQEIYNDQYPLVDPDYESVRPTANANLVEELFGSAKARLQHLDYGGGQGLLSQKLCGMGWASTSYDPFGTSSNPILESKNIDLITAFEVFEHVPDHAKLFTDINRIAHRNTVILFSTLLSDGQISPGLPLKWWYASPRNGHVSLFSSKSLAIALAKEGFSLHSLDTAYHLAWRNRPDWLPATLRI